MKFEDIISCFTWRRPRRTVVIALAPYFHEWSLCQTRFQEDKSKPISIIICFSSPIVSNVFLHALSITCHCVVFEKKGRDRVFSTNFASYSWLDKLFWLHVVCFAYLCVLFVSSRRVCFIQGRNPVDVEDQNVWRETREKQREEETNDSNISVEPKMFSLRSWVSRASVFVLVANASAEAAKELVS